MSAHRLYAPVVLGTLAAGGLAFAGTGRTWAHSSVIADGLSTQKVSVTGADAHPLASALALVVIASALAIPAASNRVRQAVGILTVVVSLVAIWMIVLGGDALNEAMTSAVKASPAFTGSNLPDDVHQTAWRLVAIAAFVLAAGLGMLTARFGRTWPTMGARYDPPPVRPSSRMAHEDADMWKALDEGRDPTQ